MTREDIIKIHEELSSKGREIIKKKNHDYCGGDQVDPFSNFRSCKQMEICSPEQGILVRMSDKFRRLITGCTIGQLKVTDESFEDTCVDLMNYTVLLYSLRKEEQNSKARALITEIKKNTLSGWTCPVDAPKHSIFGWGDEQKSYLIFITSDPASLKLPDPHCQSAEELKKGDQVSLDSTGRYLRKVEVIK